MKKFSRKRFLALILSVALCMVSSSMAFAAEEIDVEAMSGSASAGGGGGTISPMSVGSLVDCDTDTISGSGSITIHVDHSCRKPYIRAMAAGSSSTWVDCSVTLPTGQTESLGTIIADGSKTSYLYHNWTIPAGDYVFHFHCTSNSTIAVAGFIYNSY